MMTSLKTWCLLSLSVLLLLLIAPTETEVVELMSQCDEFFLEKTPPQVPGSLEKGKIKNSDQYKAICQTYRDERMFVTLYDTKNKIPVFSAYKYRGEGPLDEDKRRPKNVVWKIEPQLEDMKENKSMKDCDLAEYKQQASDDDYKNNKDYNRGHLFPSSHAFAKSDKMSTFTLTNIVPQAITFNQGSWGKMEDCVKCILENYCSNKEGYVVTGALPSPDTKVKLNNRVNIPSVLWSAFCCYSRDKKNLLARAHWGDNVSEESTNKYMQMKTLAELQQKLGIDVFPGTKCWDTSVQETVAEMNTKIGNTCTRSFQTMSTSVPPTTTQSPAIDRVSVQQSKVSFILQKRFLWKSKRIPLKKLLEPGLDITKKNVKV
ncbi:hypothetical protein Q8A73_012755 [Channa argus]|nr:hypothetical protein Q8A73_012755 [Channa argus]